jgi:hypothetical protein
LVLYTKHANGKEPLFIKSLENVQGDERDTILISMNDILPLRRDPAVLRLEHLESLRETFQALSALQEFVQ